MIRFDVVLEDIAVMVPIRMRDMNVAGSGIGPHEIAREQAS
jgi:hypothetical protein